MPITLRLHKRTLRSLLTVALFFLCPFTILQHLSNLSSKPSERERWHSVFKEDHVEAGWRADVAVGEEVEEHIWAAEVEGDEPRWAPTAAVHSEDRNGHAPQKPSHDHILLPNGLLIPDPSSPHPIYALVDQAHRNWEKKLAGASRSLREAVDEYRRRYERSPPKGFDRWWNYVEANDVQLPDEYDQIYRDLEPFYALNPSQLRSLIEEISSESGMYTIACPGISAQAEKSKACEFTIVEKGLNEEGKRVARERARAQTELLQDAAGMLEKVEVSFYSHDVPWQFVGHEYLGALEDAAAVGEFFNVDEHEIDNAHLGWASACAPHKPLRETYDPEVLPDLEDMWQNDKSFIWNHKVTMDPCVHPTLSHLVGFLSGHGKGPGPRKDIYPVLAMCKTTLHADVLAVSMEAWTEDVGEDPEWEQKDDRMLWRGKTTGIYFKDGVPWNISQRINLVDRTARTSGSLPVLSPSTDPSSPVGVPVDTPLGELNDQLVDVAFVDQAIQCDEKVCSEIQERYKFGERKDWAEGNGYKFFLDIDGNGWSARFKRLMTTNSVVLKSTIFPEWYTDRVQPWVHYVPLKASLTDLYDVLSFFRSSPSHDTMAKEIGKAGKEWSKAFWRKEDMVAYQSRLFLELARLTASDRDAASFHLGGDLNMT